MPATQAWGPESHSPELPSKLCVVQICKHSTGGWGGWCRGRVGQILEAQQPSSLASQWAPDPVRDLVSKNRWEQLSRPPDADLWPPHMHIHTYVLQSQGDNSVGKKHGLMTSWAQSLGPTWWEGRIIPIRPLLSSVSTLVHVYSPQIDR